MKEISLYGIAQTENRPHQLQLQLLGPMLEMIRLLLILLFMEMYLLITFGLAHTFLNVF